MPKSSKKKKDKAADFAKAKLKLGKGKQVANNATDTSFKARSITVPHQTIGQEKDASKPTTRRNLTLDDLLLHLKHYNPNTRKDAIWGLRELLEANPQLVDSSVTPVIQACARILEDEDAEVRKALLSLFAWFLRLIPLHKIRPHMPLLMLFITSAQTNIFPAIRVDAVRFLNLLLETTPEVVTQGWDQLETAGARVLEGYLGLLNAGSSFWTGHKDDAPAPSTSSVTLSPNSKFIVLSSLALFLRKAISPLPSQHHLVIPTWYMASLFSTHDQFLAFCALITPRCSEIADSSSDHTEPLSTIQGSKTEDFVGNFDYAWGPTASCGFSLGELREVEHIVNTITTSSSSASQSSSTSLRIARLARTMHPILVSTWLDVAPNVFGVGASGDQLDVQLAMSVAQIAGCLYGAIFRDDDLTVDSRSFACDNITSLLGYMSTYLPCVSETGDQSDDFTRELSFAYCELTSLAVLASQESLEAEPKSHASISAKQSKALSTQIVRVGEYVIKALDGELKSVSHPLGFPLTASAYTMLLPTIWSLLQHRNSPQNAANPKKILLSCINHALRTSSRSVTKGVATQFLGMLVLLHTEREGPLKFFSNLSMEELERFKEWQQHLPKVLWEIGTGDLRLTETILRLVLRIVQRRSAFLDVTTSASIRSRFIPYFIAVHPEKGELLGPFTKLTSWPHLRRLALDAAAVVIQDAGPARNDPLRMAVDRAVKDTEDAQYWFSLLL